MTINEIRIALAKVWTNAAFEMDEEHQWLSTNTTYDGIDISFTTEIFLCGNVIGVSFNFGKTKLLNEFYPLMNKFNLDSDVYYKAFLAINKNDNKIADVVILTGDMVKNVEEAVQFIIGTHNYLVDNKVTLTIANYQSDKRIMGQLNSFFKFS